MTFSVGFIGWRGLVGSVLLNRLIEENSAKGVKWRLFSTSQAGLMGPQIPLSGYEPSPLADAYDSELLATMDILIVCQGSDYTRQIYHPLRLKGWKGFWLDAASYLRYHQDSTIVLDPVNGHLVQDALESGCQTYVGGNCTVSLMLMAIAGLIKKDLVEWIYSSTYQAASGAGAQALTELMDQFSQAGRVLEQRAKGTSALVRAIDDVHQALQDNRATYHQFSAPLASNVLPWIDVGQPSGQTKEEWKAGVETNKILGLDQALTVDSTCVRVGSMRCHAQAVTIKLKEPQPLDRIHDLIANQHPWVRMIANDQVSTLQGLTPHAVSNSLNIAVGRLRTMAMGKSYINLYTVGDQLLWGAAEPLHCMLLRLLVYLKAHPKRRMINYMS